MPQGVGSQGVGILTVTAGVWMLYCAVTNQGPVKTLVAVIKDPGHARTVVQSRTGRQISTGSFVKSNVTVYDPGGAGPAAIVAFARAQIGKPYASPGDSINTWDCSGLTKAAVKAGTGIDLPHGATSQMLSLKGTSVARKDLQAGDIVFPQPGHCGVMTGPDTVIHAPTWGKTVVERKLWAFISAKRFTAPSGSPKAAV